MPVGLHYNPSEDALFSTLRGHEASLIVGCGHSWTFSKHGVVEISTDGRSLLFSQGPPPDAWWGAGHRYYLENALPLLDHESEWFTDAATRTLWYWPAGNTDPNTLHLTVSSLQQVLRVYNTENISLAGLRLSHADWDCPGGLHSNSTCDGQAASFLEMAAVEVSNSSEISFRDCTVSGVGSYGIWLQAGTTHTSISNCTVTDIGAGGVRIGISEPQYPQPILFNTLEDSIISKGGRVHEAGQGVLLQRASHNVIQHNEIVDLYQLGIALGWTWNYSPASAAGAANNTVA